MGAELCVIILIKTPDETPPVGLIGDVVTAAVKKIEAQLSQFGVTVTARSVTPDSVKEEI